MDRAILQALSRDELIALLEAQAGQIKLLTARIADMAEPHACDHIDLPPIRPIITRIHRHRGVFPCCAKAMMALAGTPIIQSG